MLAEAAYPFERNFELAYAQLRSVRLGHTMKVSSLLVLVALFAALFAAAVSARDLSEIEENLGMKLCVNEHVSKERVHQT